MTLVIADLHGRADLLEGLLANTPDSTAFVFIGDAIDRGPRNRDTIRLLGSLADAGRMTLLKGNHEAMVEDVDDAYERFRADGSDFRRADARDAFLNWMLNGGDTVVREYGGYDSNFEEGGEGDAFGPWGIPPELMAFAGRCDLAYRHRDDERGDILCAHAAPGEVKGFRSLAEAMIWARPDQGPFPLPPGCRLSVHGHTPLRAPTRLGQQLFIDLGAVWTGALCTFDLETEEIVVYQGEARRPLASLPHLEAVGGVEPLELPYRLVEL
jgi:serine/threonine protein phosphatase 1